MTVHKSQKKTSGARADARLSPVEVSAFGELLAGRNGWRGVLALAAELGESDDTIRRALQRRRMRPATVARLRHKLVAAQGEPHGARLAEHERRALAALVRAVGEPKTARAVHVSPATLGAALAGKDVRRASIARIRRGLEALTRACLAHTDCAEVPELGRSCFAARSETGRR